MGNTPARFPAENFGAEVRSKRRIARNGFSAIHAIEEHIGAPAIRHYHHHSFGNVAWRLLYLRHAVDNRRAEIDIEYRGEGAEVKQHGHARYKSGSTLGSIARPCIVTSCRHWPE